jgi:tetratricopeptide (TPR) repeat protein
MTDFDPARFEAALSAVLGQDISKVRITSIRKGSTVVRVTGDPEVLERTLKRLQNSPELLEKFKLAAGFQTYSGRLGSREAERIFGRSEELAHLDSLWNAVLNPSADQPKTNVITIIGWGGSGKTQLVSTWLSHLAAEGWPGAERVFDWSFYSQGTREEGSVSSDAFFHSAFVFFGEGDWRLGHSSPWDKGAYLAELVAGQRTLLILDGLEPLQYPPGPLGGELKDPGMRALLRGLAQKNLGLCLITTRAPIVDLAGFRNGPAPEWRLENLSREAGVDLLKSLGVSGNPVEIAALVEDVEGHALSLNLLGTYLAKAHGGDVRRRDRVDLQKADRDLQGGHVFKTMASYERWLGEGGEEGARQLAILRLMGLFDRPADAGCLEALRRPPAIPNLTEPLVDLAEEDWTLACSALRESHLLTLTPNFPKPGQSNVLASSSTLDAHPLLREYFARRLREQQPEAWRAAHSRIYEHLRDTTEHRPDTLEGLQPLYQAVAHGCQAGRQQEACDEIYWDRILRGNESFSTLMLGAIGANLGAVTSFFEPPWSRVSAALTEADQAWLLNEASFLLRALGRLTEALEPMRAGLENFKRQENLGYPAKVAGNLSELELALGEVPAAVRDAEQSVTFADRSGNEFERMVNRTTQADALHQAGLHAEALELFREAERMQAERQPKYPLLYSLRGFQYCELLLAEAERAAWRGGVEDTAIEELSRVARGVEERSKKMLEWPLHSDSLLDIALNHLTLGRAQLYRAILEGAEPTSASSEIEQAVDGLRRAGDVSRTPLALLSRAWLRALGGNPASAHADLAEAQEIAERGPMPLFLADIHLYRARLFRDREALATARALIEKHGYGRRKEELEDAEAAAKGW